MFKNKEQKRIDKEFSRIVANIGGSALRADPPERPYDDPVEQGKLSPWQYTVDDQETEKNSDAAWARYGAADTDVYEPLEPAKVVAGRGEPKYERKPGDEQAEFAAAVHADIADLTADVHQPKA